MIQARYQLQDVWRVWLKDKGCSIYMLYGLVALITCIALMFSTFKDLAQFTAPFASLSMCCAFAWQTVKLRADETISLVPARTQFILKQGFLVILLSCTVFFAISIATNEINTLNRFAIGLIAGLVVLKLTLIHCEYFKYNFYAYLFAGLSTAVEMKLDFSIFVILSAVAFVLAYSCRAKLQNMQWQSAALSYYRNALRESWLPVTNNLLWLDKLPLSRWLFPLSLYVGRQLFFWLFIITALVISISVLSAIYFNINKVPFLILNLAMTSGFVIHWARLQSPPQLTDSLLLLPLYDSKRALQLGFATANLRFTLLIAVICFIALLLGNFIAYSTPWWLSIVNALMHTTCFAAGLLSILAFSTLSSRVATSSVLLIIAMAVFFSLFKAIPNFSENVFIQLGSAAIWLTLAILANYLCCKRLFNS
ncbi:hypothetical protein ACFOEE_18860 [Pseudoalteromonas fenneropenaei]|uniref:ABC transporter permease n=1 Tax=Pseudoalteromonas fenneropenaei TaxID=1737459 RepID=A0ABV7CPT3_9GAMM